MFKSLCTFFFAFGKGGQKGKLVGYCASTNYYYTKSFISFVFLKRQCAETNFGWKLKEHINLGAEN